MTKVFSLMILSLMAILMLGAMSASTTAIAGKIYNADYSDTIPGANVTVNCNENIQTTMSLSDGAYSVTYDGTVCNQDSLLTVYAVKGSLSGSNTGIIHDNLVEGWNVGIANVSLIPEFGLFLGALTILSALVIFFVVRKK
jgi:hypothetical protein